jgi:glyoxylase-like metal-dependent hydrolase (beta-lactamase superfamily II)
MRKERRGFYLTVVPEELIELGPDEVVVLDVREPEEVRAWPFPGALHIPLGELEARLAELPNDRRIVAICASGNRSTEACRLLAAAGLDVANLKGGMRAWARAYDAAELCVDGATVIQVRRLGKGCLSYMVGSGDEAFVVDPSADIERYLELASDRGWRIRRVFDTHLHADHVSGARLLAEATGASLHLNPADSFAFDYLPLEDGQHFALPGGVRVEVAALHTPGHTEGSTMYFVGDDAVLTGDTLFVDGVGRPDLAERAEQFARNLHRSLVSKVLMLPDDAMVLPAHYGPDVLVRKGQPVAAPLGELRQRLEPLRMGEEEFVSWAAARVVERPPNFETVVRANMGRVVLAPEERELIELGPNRCSL